MVLDFAIKEKFSLESPIKIVSIGRFEFLKGSDTIKNTIINLNKFKLPFIWSLLIPQLKNDEMLLKEIENLVIIKRGYDNNQVLDYIENMDVLFFPSRSEGFSMSIIESLKRGLIVITRDIPMGIPEMITNNFNGIICKDEFEFISAIQKLIEKPDDFFLMKSNANKLANQQYGYEIMCKRLYNLIVSTEVSYFKKFAKVKLLDPMLPEYVLRTFRYFKYKLIKWC
jgi:glycosyltransferase involved in cell wall biosynthesis